MSNSAKKPVNLPAADWNDFIQNVMALNADEALFLACALEEVGLPKIRIVPAHIRSSSLNLPKLLFNYACLQKSSGIELDVDGDLVKALVDDVSKRVKYEKAASEIGRDVSYETERLFDGSKIKLALRSILSKRLNVIEACTRKLAQRVEFQALEAQEVLPVSSSDMFELAFNDAADGWERGFAWSCFQLRQVFENSSAGVLNEDDAFNLYADLKEIPNLLLDLYGEAGLDVALRMEKMLNKIGVMPFVPMNTPALLDTRPQ